MSHDKRLWAKIDLGYFSNPKVADVLDESTDAVCMHIASILHSGQHLTDGHVSPRAMQRAIGGSNDDTQLLIEHGLWHAPGHDCADCPEPEENRVYVHDFLAHNRSSDKVERDSANAKKAARARWEKKKNSKPQATPPDANRMQSASEPHADRMQTALQDAMQTDMPNAMQSRVEESREENTNNPPDFPAEESRADVTAILDRLDEHCRQHGYKIPARGKTNTNAARLLLDRDKYTVAQVMWMIDWVTKDDFWHSNIMSMANLRKHFDRLKAQATRQQVNKAPQDSNMAPGSERALSTLQLGQRLQEQADQNETQQRMIS